MRRVFYSVVVFVLWATAVGLVDVQAQPERSTVLQVRGGVQMQVGDLEIRADQVEVSMGESQLEASGNVVVRMDPSNALANRTEVVGPESRVVMSGNVVIATDNVRLTTDEAEIDTATGTIYAARARLVLNNP